MPNAGELKLGKKPGAVHDPRSLRLARFLTPPTEPPPKTWRIAQKLHDWPVFGNDRYGDCTCASQAHRVLAQEWSAGQRDRIQITATDVLDLYGAVTGFIPSRPETDQGAYLIDVLRYLWRNGFGREADGTPHTIGAYATVNVPVGTLDTLAMDALKRAARTFGGLYVGLGLPTTAADEIDAGKPWADTTGRAYSWGGHAVTVIGYDTKGLTAVTWGREQRMTWDWFCNFCDEIWVTISEDFLNRKGRTPQGLNTEALQATLAALR